MDTTYWRGGAEDEAMQEEHGFIWRAMLETIDVDLAGKRVLDAGCNRGGFLRLLADWCGIAEGAGYDPAASAVADARGLVGHRPLQFEASDTVPAGWDCFDVAFSHEVLYLVHDLSAHATDLFGALAPGGVYFAVMGVHSRSPLMLEWHSANAEELRLPKLYDIDEVVAAFRGAGFDVSAARLAMRFVPAGGHGHHGRGQLVDWLDYYYDHKLLLRFSR
ncbi:MAG TPA: methyltransferase domain-containing protein [Acidimicrobiales bacterium]|jgi:SAM-dependent methyltransferase|nr:methyltransferase domain-containing protein [Acidimicrobiales bacterium]